MTLDTGVALVLVLVLAAWVLAALIHPERF